MNQSYFHYSRWINHATYQLCIVSHPQWPTSKPPDLHQNECKQRQSLLLLANSCQDLSQCQNQHFLPTNLPSPAPSPHMTTTCDIWCQWPHLWLGHCTLWCTAALWCWSGNSNGSGKPLDLLWQSSTRMEKIDQDHCLKASSQISLCCWHSYLDYQQWGSSPKANKDSNPDALFCKYARWPPNHGMAYHWNNAGEFLTNLDHVAPL